MTLATAQSKVRKAQKTLSFAKSKGLPCHNYPLIAYNNAYYKLSTLESELFSLWYDKFIEKNKTT